MQGWPAITPSFFQKFGAFGAVIFIMVHCAPKENSSHFASPVLLNPTLPVERESQSPPRLLFVGDSLSSGSPFALNLIEDLRQLKKSCSGLGFEYEHISSFALPSSSPRHYEARSGSNRDWLCQQKKIYRNKTQSDQTGAGFCKDIGQQSPFEKLVSEAKPTDVIIALGTNSLAFNADFIVTEVNDLLEQLPEGSRCFWVAPTFVSSQYHAKVKKVEKSIAEALDSSSIPCHLISTFDEMQNQTQCSSFNTSDGFHHTACGSQIWAEEVFEKFCAAY